VVKQCNIIRYNDAIARHYAILCTYDDNDIKWLERYQMNAANQVLGIRAIFTEYQLSITAHFGPIV